MADCPPAEHHCHLQMHTSVAKQPAQAKFQPTYPKTLEGSLSNACYGLDLSWDTLLITLPTKPNEAFHLGLEVVAILMPCRCMLHDIVYCVCSLIRV